MPKAGYTQLSYYQKLHLKEMLEEKRYTKIKMAEKLHVSKSTIYNEIKRGTINGVYDPKYSERKRSESRSGSMFDKNPELALYISRLIIEEHMSPEMIIKQLKNEPDKFEKAGFTAENSEKVDAPIIKELPICVECKLKSYDKETCRLVGEIVNVSVDERVLDKNGNVDVVKAAPITFDPFNNAYIRLGEKVGDAFKAGAALK